MDALTVLMIAGAVLIILRLLSRFFSPRGWNTGYRRIKSWLKERYQLSFQRDADPGSIRMQLESVLSQETARLNADYEARRDYYEAERKKKRWRKPFNAEKRLRGFKAFVEKQDYSILVE